ncbi:TRAP transporter substrate-binding protein DctP [Oceanibacterium hippocampi]|uniref:Sialic acid-binding periplasmic protein SiaP n=1 Tax=Oceanibacterium hippocampi TaxID=745714 RepID=A0A1Y5TS93_9PROT|nr:TRAP transporter substrate-binding protein DctP [Oceanibacterium hippocampi]SLN66802.1 Sialic acid-binding periplasmic protein SiaP precursor [Oceanibacterium hippocampi]
MINKTGARGLCGLLVAMVVVLGSHPISAKVVLRMNHQLSAQTLSSEVDAWAAQQILERTNGEVEIKIFWSEGLGKSSENLSLLKNQAMDMAAFSPAYFPAQLPFHTAPNSLPMAIDGPKQAQVLMDRLVEEVPAYRMEQAANGIRLISMHIINPYIPISKEPITSVADMTGLKVRTWGKHMPRMAEAVSATPVSMSVPEIYENLSRGVIDASPFAIDLMVTYKLYEVATHVADVSLWCGPSYGVWINEGAWRKLTAEQQNVILEVYEEAKKLDLDKANAAASEARAKLEGLGVTFHEMPEQEKLAWKEALPDFFGEWIAEMEALGKGDDARKSVEIWNDVIANVSPR